MKALLIVDIQNDFLPGGALAVPDGDAIVPIVNELMSEYDLVVATQDWHPENHISFADNHDGKQVGEIIQVNKVDQHLWPVHCVENTPGAAFPDTLDHRKIDHLIRKGGDPNIDSYSGFFDNGHQSETGLAPFLNDKGIEIVDVVGLATDYCVKFTALDSVRLGFETRLIVDACRGVDLNAGDVGRAIETMRNNGVKIVAPNLSPAYHLTATS